MADMKRIVVIGATSVIAEHCCRLWLEAGPADLLLVARDRDKAERIATDLRVRSPSSHIAVATTDFVDTAAIEKVADDATAGGPVDIVLIAHGWLADQSKSQNDLAFCREVLDVNALSPALFAEAFAKRMEPVGRGTIAIIGSVAGDRGRRVNYVYGASKGFLARYAEGLDHRLAATGVRVMLAKPGPTDTPMAADYRAAGKPLASPEAVARSIVTGVEKGRYMVYAPAKWQLIMLIVRHLPRIIFNRLNI